MTRDIDSILAVLTQALPALRWEQLRVSHPGADDDGLWFLTHPASRVEVQLESSTGMLPFLLEGTDGPDAEHVASVQQAVERVAMRLGVSLAAS